MPTYQYVCEACSDEFEVVQSFSDPTLTAHDPGCGGPVHKRFSGVGVVFKGSGFYRNDSRSGGASGSTSGGGSKDSGGASASGGSSEKSASSSSSATSSGGTSSSGSSSSAGSSGSSASTPAPAKSSS